jgi:hypothetical protein
MIKLRNNICSCSRREIKKSRELLQPNYCRKRLLEMPNLRKWNIKRERKQERVSRARSNKLRGFRMKWRQIESSKWRRRDKRSNTSSRCLKRIKRIWISRKSIRKKKDRKMFVHR